MALRLKDALLHKNGASGSGRAAYGVQFRVCLNLEVEIETEGKVLCAEIQPPLLCVTCVSCCMIGSLITEETEMSNHTELVCEVESYTRTETNVPDNSGVTVITVYVYIKRTCADAYSTVNKELDKIVACAEICPTCIRIEVEHVEIGLAAVPMPVLVTDAQTYSPLAVEVIADLWLNVEGVGLKVTVPLSTVNTALMCKAKVAAYVPVFCVYTEGRCDSHHCESKNFLHNFLLFLGIGECVFQRVLCVYLSCGEKR